MAITGPSRSGKSTLANIICGIGGIVLVVAAVGAIALRALIGIVTGMYPARRAAHLDPVEALRYE